MSLPRLAAATLALVLATPAFAGLDGASVSVDYRFPDLATVYGGATPSVSPFVVGAGVETVVNVEGVTFISADFTDLGLTLTFDTVLGAPTWNTVPFNGLVFTSSAFAGLTGATVLGSTTFGSPLFDASRLTLTGSELRLNWNGISYADGQQLHIAFTDGVIPEPATWAMMIAGFGLVGAAMRRRAPAAA
jgi:hypothetical protein